VAAYTLWIFVMGHSLVAVACVVFWRVLLCISWL